MLDGTAPFSVYRKKCYFIRVAQILQDEAEYIPNERHVTAHEVVFVF
jgi:hypothetical protein